MHISEGVLNAPVLIGGAAIAVAGTAIGLKKLDFDRTGQAGILAACFFVASLIHVPLGPSNVHLIMNGLVGLLLGWSAFPVILVALLLQAVLFQYGGITTLGVNTVVMAVPAVVACYTFRFGIRLKPQLRLPAAFCSGLLGVLLAGLLAAIALVFANEDFLEVALLLVTAHLPIMLIEGIITAFCIAFLTKVQPEIFTIHRQEQSAHDR